MDQPLRLKPHHFLDLLRDFGAGVAHRPHPYGHAVHLVARCLLEDPGVKLELTVGADSICTPCRNLVRGRCTDTSRSPGHLISKERWNSLLDGRIFECLELKEGDCLSALELCRLSRRVLENLERLYAEQDPEKTSGRRKNLALGIDLFLKLKK